MHSLLLLFALSAPSQADKPFRFPEARIVEKAELKYVENIPLLRVSGTPAEIGDAVGQLALGHASRVLVYPGDLLESRGASSLFNVFKGAGKSLYKNFPEANRVELEAIAKGSKANRDLVICGNTFFDLKKVFACSALMVGSARSSTGGPMLARNLDYPSLGYIHKFTLVTVYRGNDKLAFVSVGFPGLVGVLSGMNEAGVALGVLEVFDSKDNPPFNNKGITYGLCLRKVLEEARSIAEAKKILERLPRTTTINVAMADRDGVAVLEVTPLRVVRRDAVANICVTTNHFCTAEQKAENTVNIDQTFERYARLDEVRKSPHKLTPDDLRKHLDAVNLGNLTLQTMAFEPATLRLHLGFGTVPSSKLPMKRLDLAELFKRTDRR